MGKVITKIKRVNFLRRHSVSIVIASNVNWNGNTDVGKNWEWGLVIGLGMGMVIGMIPRE